jgi:WD40 repeat protein
VVVSQSKFEPIPLTCRNLVAVAESSICYVTTAKRNVLRVIDTTSGQSKILKGHESCISDLKFSCADRYILCSTDDTSKTHIWNLSRPENPLFRCYPFTASIIQSHPGNSNTWALAKFNEIYLVEVDPATSDLSDYSQEIRLAFTMPESEIIGNRSSHHLFISRHLIF